MGESRLSHLFPSRSRDDCGELTRWTQMGPVCVVHGKVGSFASDWPAGIPELVQRFSEEIETKWESTVRVESLETEVILLKNRCDILERTAPLVVPIETFAPEPYEVIKAFHCVVRLQDGEYIASFFDANLSASGDTYSEAVFNLKDVIVGTFEMLTMMDEDDLGPGPLQQKRVMEEFLHRKE